MKRERILAIAGVMLLATSVVQAGTLTTVDARIHSGALVAVETPGEVVWRLADGTRLVLPTDEVDRIDLAAVRGWADGSPAWLITAGGMRLPGRPVSTEEGQLTWEHPILGQLVFALEDLRAFLPPQTGRTSRQVVDELMGLLEGTAETDVVCLASGDVISGVVETLDADVLTFNCKMGKLRIESTNISSLVFSEVLKPYRAPETTHVQLVLADGSVLVGDLKSAPARLGLVSSLGQSVSVPTASVVTVQFLNTKLLSLSELAPAFVSETPYFDRVWPWQRNRSVWNGPLTIAGRTYENGIGMHARCQLDFQLDGRYRVFLTDVGIDDEVNDSGDCVVVVYGDGAPLIKPVVITGKMGRKFLRIEVSGVERLTLLADFGEGADAGDHVTWGNARLVRK